MAKKSQMPDLRNATPEFLIDEIGALAEKRKADEKIEKFYKEALKARAKKLGLTFVRGEKFEGTITTADRVTINTAQIKEEMGEDWVLERSRSTEVVTVKTGRLGTLGSLEEEDIAED